MKKMTKKMITTNIMVFIVAYSLIGCGNAVPTLNEEDLDLNNVSDNDLIEDTGIDMDDEVVADAINDLPDDVVETIIEDGVVPTSSELDLLEEDIVEPEPTPSPHVHQYVESITVQPTCAVAGEKTLTCECGDIKIESVPATGSHNWVEQTVVVHHDELGHVEQEKVLVGWTETRHEYECNYCGHRENSLDAIQRHYDSYISEGNIDHVFSRTFIYDYPPEPIYETQSKWVVDQESWDETVVTGYTCSVCGVTKSANTVDTVEQTNTVE